MPTGYTAAVVDGKITEFPEFAMQCARAFGALITMRDDPMDAEIPAEFKPCTWNTEALARAWARLASLNSMTLEERYAAALAAYEEGCAQADKYNAKDDEENRRLSAMADKVRAWNPPTAEHVEMKSFMLEQLNISKHDARYRHQHPEKLSGQAWHEKEIKSAMREVEYHAGEQAKEEERAKGRTAWVKALRASLEPRAAVSP